MLSSPNSGACLTNKLQRLLIEITVTLFNLVDIEMHTELLFLFVFALLRFVCQCSIKLESNIWISIEKLIDIHWLNIDMFLYSFQFDLKIYY